MMSLIIANVICIPLSIARMSIPVVEAAVVEVLFAVVAVLALVVTVDDICGTCDL